MYGERGSQLPKVSWSAIVITSYDVTGRVEMYDLWSLENEVWKSSVFGLPEPKDLVPALRIKRALLFDFVFHAVAFPLDEDGFSMM